MRHSRKAVYLRLSHSRNAFISMGVQTAEERSGDSREWSVGCRCSLQPTQMGKTRIRSSPSFLVRSRVGFVYETTPDKARKTLSAAKQSAPSVTTASCRFCQVTCFFGS
uniref:Uncharacterized protein n=1 Tax=Toxoplasma gondii (strain ATCC 50861 / VEG) TaxID=432359 RepID=A0A0F7UYZ4_TOXGV|nr:TPA: hypothetical protein BN1205_103880 [Toxoplasma gondii VEG]